MRLSLPGKVFAAFAILLFTFGGVTVFSVLQVRQIGHDVGHLHATLLPLAATLAGLGRDLQSLDLLLEQTEPGTLRRAVHLARRVRPTLGQLDSGFGRVADHLNAAGPEAAGLGAELLSLEPVRSEFTVAVSGFYAAVEAGTDPEETRRVARLHLRTLRRGL